MRIHLARILRRAANRLDPQRRTVSIRLISQVGEFVNGMNRARDA